MTDREKLIELQDAWFSTDTPEMYGEYADFLIANGVTVQKHARLLEEWGEDYGDVLWWVFPIEEPPYVGSPLDCNWPGYHTHWTSFDIPLLPKDLEETNAPEE